MVNYTEELFNAIKTISKKEVEALHFDTTVEVTVTDASKAHLGIYTVTNGSIYFTAYSTNTYKEKDRVLVMIPQGDYDQQKIIIGKKSHGDVDKPINYTEPFSQIIDVTNNLVSENIAEFGMVANGAKGKWENSDTSELIKISGVLNESCLIWSAIPYEALQSINTILIDYQNGNHDNTYENEYGILMEYSDYDEEQGQFDWDSYFDNSFCFIGNENDIKNMEKTILFRNGEFKEEKGLARIGLKADFKTLLKQFNAISGNYGLVLCVGFRNPDEQLSKNGLHSTIIQPFVFDSKDFFGNIYNFNAYYTQEAVFDISQYSDLILSDIFLFGYQKSNFKDINGKLIPSENVSENIFINNYYICLGNDISEFKGDSLELYSFNETLFNKTNDNSSNSKNIYLRWIHQYETSNVVKALTNSEITGLENYEVRWYRYKLGAPSPDSFMGAHWELIILSENADKTTYQLDVDTTKEFERIQVAVIKNSVQLIARSNILEFTNEKEIVNNSLVKDINALSIRYNDDRHGNYFVYDSMQNVLNNEDTIIRQLTAVFADNIENVYDKSVLSDCESIKWIFPDSNSMIVPLDFNQDIIDFKNEDQEKTQVDDFWVQHINGNYIVSKDDLGGAADISKYTSIYYKINKNLNFNFGRNTVYLEVIKNGQTYIASITMQFNIAGTSGSGYSLVVNWSGQKNTFDVNKNGEELSGDIILLDPQGYEVELNSDANYEYDWYNFNGTAKHLEFSLSNNNNSHFSISKIDGLNINELYILEVKLTNFGNYELITRVPVPLTALYDALNPSTQLFKITEIEGPTSIRYSSEGQVSFNKNCYNIYGFQIYENSQWVFKELDNVVFKLIPKLQHSQVGFPRLTSLENNISNGINKLVSLFDEQPARFLQSLIIYTTDIDENNPDINNFNLKNLDDLNFTNCDFDKEHEGFNNIDLQLLKNKYIQLFTDNKKSIFSKIINQLKQFITFDNNKQDLSFLSERELNSCLLFQWFLYPSDFYIKNLESCGIQLLYNNQVLWTQPIYIYQNNYPSDTINSWDGSLLIDNNNSLIFSQGIAAGRKEVDNTFSGVILGDWTETTSEVPSSLNKYTGVYGFSHGQMAYSLKEDGTATFGNGAGKIELKGSTDNSISAEISMNNGQRFASIKPGEFDIGEIKQLDGGQSEKFSLLKISSVGTQPAYFLQSSNYSETAGSEAGTYIDLAKGIIKGYNFSLFSQTTTDNNIYNLQLSSGNSNLPFLKIGRKKTLSQKIINNQDLFNEFLDNQSTFQQTIDEQFNLFMTMFDNLNSILQIYPFSNDFINHYSSRLVESQNPDRKRTTFITGLREDPYYNNSGNDNFAEISSLLMSQLTKSQQTQLLNMVKNYGNNNDSDLANLTLNENNNLLYPKWGSTFLNRTNVLYDTIIENYNTLLENVEGENNNPTDEDINALNNEVLSIMTKTELPRIVTSRVYTYLNYTQNEIGTTEEDQRTYYKINNGYEILDRSGLTTPEIDGFYLEIHSNTIGDRYNSLFLLRQVSTNIYESQILYLLENSIYLDLLVVENKSQKQKVTFEVAANNTQKPLIIRIKTDGVAEAGWIPDNNEDGGKNYYLKTEIPTTSERYGLDRIKAIYSDLINTYKNNLQTCQEHTELLIKAYNDFRWAWRRGKTGPGYGLTQLSVNNTNFYTTAPYMHLSDKMSDYKISTLENDINYYKNFYKFDNEQYKQINLTDIRNGTLILPQTIPKILNYAVKLYDSDNKTYYPIIKKYDATDDTATTPQTITFYNFTELGLLVWENTNTTYNESIYENPSSSSAEITLFEATDWDNDLIHINKNGGYITSKDYRPTVSTKDKTMRLPTADQENHDGQAFTQGMKGFVIDLTNNRFFLGDNASIQGVQTQYYPGEIEAEHRHFIISTGVTLKTQNGRDVFSSDNKWFILAQGGPTAGRGGKFRQLFGVDWNGTIWCRDIKYFT